jgi:exoribonuclease R
MPARRIRVDPVSALRDGFEAIRREAGVPDAFPPAVLAGAEAAAAKVEPRDRVDVPFVTIDPPGARDLDQALHIERDGDGHRVRYAIADVGAFVEPGGALDAEATARALTVYAPDRKVPLHPPVLSEGAASLLPGEWRPALVWTLDLDAAGELTEAQVVRADVRSVAQHTYEDVPPEVEPLLREVGERRIALERARGGVRLAIAEQEVVQEGDTWTVRYRVPLPSEDHNAQISLLTGIAAARLMLGHGCGILRSQPPPDEKALARLRLEAQALGVAFAPQTSYAEFVRSLDPAVPAHASLMQEAATTARGAGYTAFDGERPAEAEHFAIAAPYAHATAPLRRLQDRHVSACCLAACAGEEVPAWVRAALPGLPAAMTAGARRARAVARGVVDLVEAALLSGREGERFDAVVVDEETIQLREPAVRAQLKGAPEPGSEVVVRLESADVAARAIRFAVAR